MQHVVKNVAIIGGGPAGLCAARILGASGCAVTVFEQAASIGGQWSAHSKTAMYENLRTNLPKEIMPFSELAFSSELPSFLTWQNVYDYLDAYAQKFNLYDNIRLNTQVDNVEMVALNNDDSKTSSSLSEPYFTTDGSKCEFPKWKVSFSPTGMNNSDLLSTHLSSRSQTDFKLLYPDLDLNIHPSSSSSSSASSSTTSSQIFDGVVVCNGHFFDPYVPLIQNLNDTHGQIDNKACVDHKQDDGGDGGVYSSFPHTCHKFKGKVLHSMQYKTPNHPDFVGKRIIIVGSGASGVDLSNEIRETAKYVGVSFTGCPHVKDLDEWKRRQQDEGKHSSSSSSSSSAAASNTEPHLSSNNRHYKKLPNVNDTFPPISHIDNDGSIVFDDGRSVEADCILFATGYNYSYPFFPRSSSSSNKSEAASQSSSSSTKKPPIQVVEGKQVVPLYKEIYQPFAPSLCFMGLNVRVVPFPLFEYQAHAIAAVFSGRKELPSPEDMITETRLTNMARTAVGLKPHYLEESQWAYISQLAIFADVPNLPPVRARIYEDCANARSAFPSSYRERSYKILDRTEFQVKAGPDAEWETIEMVEDPNMH